MFGNWLTVFAHLFLCWASTAVAQKQLWLVIVNKASQDVPVLVSLAGKFGHVKARHENKTGLVTGFLRPSPQLPLACGGHIKVSSMVPSSFRASKQDILVIVCQPFHITLASSQHRPQLTWSGRTSKSSACFSRNHDARGSVVESLLTAFPWQERLGPALLQYLWAIKTTP